MIQQLVMYEEELQQINSICEILHRESNAKAVLVIDKNGQAIAQAGELEDLDTADLFTEVSRGVDKWLWFVEAHAQAAG